MTVRDNRGVAVKKMLVAAGVVVPLAATVSSLVASGCHGNDGHPPMDCIPHLQGIANGLRMYHTDHTGYLGPLVADAATGPQRYDVVLHPGGDAERQPSRSVKWMVWW
jgi:hypothetical protein